jgi:hypothetical protein
MLAVSEASCIHLPIHAINESWASGKNFLLLFLRQTVKVSGRNPFRNNHSPFVCVCHDAAARPSLDGHLRDVSKRLQDVFWGSYSVPSRETIGTAAAAAKVVMKTATMAEVVIFILTLLKGFETDAKVDGGCIDEQKRRDCSNRFDCRNVQRIRLLYPTFFVVLHPIFALEHAQVHRSRLALTSQPQCIVKSMSDSFCSNQQLDNVITRLSLAKNNRKSAIAATV